jgi:hypothetical protein
LIASMIAYMSARFDYIDFSSESDE